MADEALFRDLRYILRRAARGSIVEFTTRGRDHYTHIEELFDKGDLVTITHPEVTVNYGMGTGLMPMRENGPTHHTLSLEDTLFDWVGEPNWSDGHVCIQTSDGPLHIYLDPEAEIA